MFAVDLIIGLVGLLESDLDWSLATFAVLPGLANPLDSAGRKAPHGLQFGGTHNWITALNYQCSQITEWTDVSNLWTFRTGL
jgi:hypothetical protein